MIAVDTNVIAALYLTSPHSAAAERALAKDADWAAPLLWRSEFCSLLALYLRKNLLTLNDAQQILTEAAALLHGREFEVPGYHILRLAAAGVCSAHNCEFVALAQDLGIQLVTLDRRILDHYPQSAIPLESFAP